MECASWAHKDQRDDAIVASAVAPPARPTYYSMSSHAALGCSSLVELKSIGSRNHSSLEYHFCTDLVQPFL